MKIRITYCFVLLQLAFYAQERILPITNSGRQTFAGKLFLFGLNQDEKVLTLKVYSVLPQLKPDSLAVEIKGKAEDYLRLYSDTLHGFLNIYIQKSKSRTVKVVRINRSFSVHSVLDEIDITRLNSISFFEKEILYAGKDVYTVKSSESDSAGRQFYLNKYTLRSDKENFEYDAKWQFPFEKQFIRSAQLVTADKQHVFLYVNIQDGSKKGQWYLMLDAAAGKLIKAQKVNAKGDTSSYVLHKAAIDSASRSHYLFGQKFSGAEFDPFSGSLTLTGKKFGIFFLTVIDSSGEIVSKNEFKIPVTDVITHANKLPSGYLTKTSRLKYIPGEGIKLEMDVFKSVKNKSECYRYSNTASFYISEKEGAFQQPKNVISSNAMIDQFFLDVEPSDLSNCICTDSLADLFSILLKADKKGRGVSIKKDSAGNYLWLLRKSNQKKSLLVLALLGLDKKVYKLRPLVEVQNSLEPFVEIISEKEVLIGKQTGEGYVRLQLLPW